jgi:uncharacterized protein
MNRRTAMKTSLAAALAIILSNQAGAQETDKISKATFDTVMAFMGAMGKGDTDAMTALMADDMIWHNEGDTTLPWIRGDIKGKNAIFAFLEVFGANLKTTKWENTDAFASGDTVAVFGVMNGMTPHSGKEIGDFSFALRAKVRDGKVVLWHWFEDSFARRAKLNSPISLPECGVIPFITPKTATVSPDAKASVFFHFVVLRFAPKTSRNAKMDFFPLMSPRIHGSVMSPSLCQIMSSAMSVAIASVSPFPMAPIKAITVSNVALLVLSISCAPAWLESVIARAAASDVFIAVLRFMAGLQASTRFGIVHLRSLGAALRTLCAAI